MHDARKPNLFILGAMKSGTTLLWKLLGSHPSIYMSTPKEPCYFVEPTQLRNLHPFFWSQGYWQSQERYLQLFQSNNNELFAGEASVYYTHLPRATGVAEKIRQFNPDARLIYIIRDPVERTISHYWHGVIHSNEDRSLLRAISEERQYCDVSYYAMQLMPYLDRFKSEQIKILTFEELIENPDETIKSIFRWLGLDFVVTIHPVIPVNITPDIVMQRARWWSIVKRAAGNNGIVLRAIHSIPKPIRQHVDLLLSSPINRRNTNIEAVVRGLQHLKRRQTEELSQLISRDFPEWETLNSSPSEILRIEP